MGKIWLKTQGVYTAHAEESKILKSDGSGYKLFFGGRSDSIKNKIADKLNRGVISEAQGWREFAENIRKRAHSYREDVDSGLDHLGFLNDDGSLTELGFKFVDACERTKNPNGGYPLTLLGAALLKNGQLAAWLHYIYRLSEKKFQNNPLEFSIEQRGNLKFDQNSYLDWIETELSENLGVMRKVSLRGGTQRKPFQAELAVLRAHNIVGGFRVGVGLEVNWPKTQELLSVDI